MESQNRPKLDYLQKTQIYGNTHDMGNMTQLNITNKIGEIKENLLTSGTPEILPSSPLGYNDYLKL